MMQSMQQMSQMFGMPLPGMMPGGPPADGQPGGQPPAEPPPIERHSINELEEKEMFDFMQMANSPQSREMLFQMMSQQVGQAPPEVREAISKVEVIIKRNERGFELRIGQSDNATGREDAQGIDRQLD